MTTLDIVIAGAGIGGAAAALALRRAGHAVTVLEQAPELAPVGAGIQMAPNATRILARWGAADALAPDAVVPRRVIRRSWDDGRVLGERPLGGAVEARYGAPFWHVHRADLHAALVSAATSPDGPGRPAVFRLGTEAAGVEAGGTAVVTSGGGRYEGDLVVVADGVHSRLRTGLLGDPAAGGRARPRGVAYRAVIRADGLAADPDLASITGPEPALTEWLSPGVHAIHYFVSGGRLLNMAVLRYGTEADPGAESWLRESDTGEFLGLIDGWDQRLAALARKADRVFCTGVYERPPMEDWIRGRACLLGDAAHPMMPTQAQGAAQSIEDAWFLGRVLHGVGRDGIDAALRAYQDERLPRTAAVQRLSSVDRGKDLGRPAGAGTPFDERPGGPGKPGTDDKPADFGPYEWLWPYGMEIAGDAS